jgi:hypothetical protein
MTQRLHLARSAMVALAFHCASAGRTNHALLHRPVPALVLPVGLVAVRPALGGGAYSTCQPPSPVVERCNLCDDDKNGVVDDGVAGQQCTLSDSCVGVTSCVAGVGSCGLTAQSRRPCAACGPSGTQACLGSATYSACQPSQATVEQCNLCDDDRNGIADDGLSGNSCTQSNGCSGLTVCASGVGSCEFSASTSTRSCSGCGIGGFQTCYGTGGQTSSIGPCRPAIPKAETCDACDDDADGSLDTASGAALVRPCPDRGGCSTQSCQAGQWSVCTLPNLEQCNGLDDTCDGVIDEGGVCSVATGCACVPRTCAGLGQSGVSMPDGCGAVLNCP